MVTLAANVSNTATTWPISAALASSTQYLLVDDELAAVITPALRDSQREPVELFCEVQRGHAGVRAAHLSGATLTELESPPLGSGDGTTPTFADADPGPLGPGAIWVQTEAGGGGFGYTQTWIRDALDVSWVAVGPAIVQDGPDGTTFMASPDGAFTMSLAVTGEVTNLPQGEITYLSSRSLKNADILDLPTRATELREGTTDPSAGAGLVAKLTSLYFRVNGTAGEMWVKTGEADTAWTKLTP